MTRVDLFGTVRLDRPSKLRDELETFSDGADVLFVETPRDTPTSDERRELLVRHPAVYLTSALLGVVWGLPGRLVTRRFGPVDQTVTERVADDADAAVEPVGVSLPRAVGEVTAMETAISWVQSSVSVLLMMAAVVLFVGQRLLPTLLPGVSPLTPGAIGLVIGILPATLLARDTLLARTEQVADNVEQAVSSRDDVDVGCVVVGAAQVSGVSQHLTDRDVTVGEIHRSTYFRRNL